MTNETQQETCPSCGSGAMVFGACCSCGHGVRALVRRPTHRGRKQKKCRHTRWTFGKPKYLGGEWRRVDTCSCGITREVEQ